MAATTVAYEPMKMTDLINITQEMSAAGAALKKDAGANSAATSTECIESLQSCRRGLRFKLPGTSGSSIGHCLYIGLTSAADCPQHRDSVDEKSLTYAACIIWTHFRVYESGSKIGDFGTVKTGDAVDIRLTSEDLPKIEYCVNGEVRYTSKKETSKQAPLFVKVCGYCPTPMVEDLQWIIEGTPATQTAELHASVAKQQIRIAALETQINEQQAQLRTCEGEKQSLQERADEKEASLKVHLQEENDALRTAIATLEEQLRMEEAASHAAVERKNELQEQLQQRETRLQGEISALQGEISAQQGEISALQAASGEKVQLREQLEEEKAAARAAITENLDLQAVIEALQADIAHYQMEIKAGSDALLSVTREKADLLLQMEDQREAARIASDTKVHLQEENDTLRTAIASLEEQLWMKEAASRAAVERENELQAELFKYEKRTANIWNLLAFILALISALALNHLVGIVRGNSA